MKRYSAEEKRFLYQIIPGNSYVDIVKFFHAEFEYVITTAQVKSFCANNKISTGRTGHFKLGNVPFNKGIKGLNGKNSTTFAKGHRPHNWLPVGSERMSKDGYLEVKVAEPNKWKAKHRVVWESLHDITVPKGHVIVFCNGNRLDFSCENLIKVSRGELAVMNRMGLPRVSEEIAQSAVYIAQLSMATAKAKKKSKK